MKSAQSKAEYSKQFENIVRGVEVISVHFIFCHHCKVLIFFAGIHETTRIYIANETTARRGTQANLSECKCSRNFPIFILFYLTKFHVPAVVM
jgi:hypothetical protein